MDKKSIIDMMREIVQPDISGLSLVEHSILAGDRQFSVYSSISENTESQLERTREHAAELLLKKITELGISADDLIEFPTLEEYLSRYGLRRVVN